MIPDGHGVVAYRVLYLWFTDVSGFGLAEQATMLMHPTSPKREEELAERVEMWQDKMRRLEAHGEEYKLASACTINALRMRMIGKAKGYFDLWEADRDPTDAAKTYEDLLNRVKDDSRRRELEKFREGEDPTRRKHHGRRSGRRIHLGGALPGQQAT
jgi:hypothetical protein